MNFEDFAPAAGPVVAGVIAAAVAFSVNRSARRREGSWDALNVDLDIANKLPEGDPTRVWLEEYVLVRLRAYAWDETIARRPGWKVYSVLVLLLLLLFANLGWSIQTVVSADPATWVQWFTLTLNIATTVYGCGLTYRRRKLLTASHTLRGVRNYTGDSSTEVARLHLKMGAMIAVASAAKKPVRDAPPS